MTVRFVQGYRFLDSCGEAIIQLENTLEENWLPGELKPTGGIMRNYALGLVTTFDTEQVTVAQSDFIDFGIFSDQTTKIYETLWRLFKIDKVLSPAFRIDIRAGFENLKRADLYIQKLGFASPSPQVEADLGGEMTAIHSIICSEQPTRRFDHDLVIRRRLATKSISSTKQPDFDSRIMQRTRLLAPKHQAAVRGLLELRRKHVSSVEDAAQISFEESLEGEIETRAFSMRDFLESVWNHTLTVFPRYDIDWVVE